MRFRVKNIGLWGRERAMSLKVKISLVLLGLFSIWGLIFGASLIIHVNYAFLQTSKEMSRITEGKLKEISATEIRDTHDLLVNGIQKSIKRQSQGILDIPFSLYRGDESKIKEAINQKNRAIETRSKANMDVLYEAMFAKAEKTIDEAIRHLESHGRRQARILAKKLKIGLAIFIFSGLTILVLGMSFLINKVVIRRIDELIKETQRIAKGDLSKLITLKYPRDELDDLAASFNKMTSDLKDTTVSKEYLDNIMDNMTDTLIVVKPEGTIQSVNQAALDLLGYSENELVSESNRMIFEEKILSKGTIVADLTQKGFINNAEKNYLTKEGKEIPVLLSASVMRDSNGEIEGTICLARNISERKLLENERMKSGKLESVGVLAAGIAHDFNNLLTGIMNNIYLAKFNLQPEDKAIEKLAEAEKAVERAGDLAQQLLTFSEVSKPVKENISVKKTIRDSAKFVLRGSNVESKYYFPEDLWPIEVDKGQFNQVIQNLLINANQAMPTGGTIAIHARNITITAKSLLPLQEGAYVNISIEDQGEGIAEEHISKIFDPYFSVNKEGSGLGLSIVHSIINNHGGFISVESKLGAGTTFHLFFPASKVEPQANDITAKIFRGTGRILIMDDERVIRESAADALVMIGYEVELVSDGLETIEHYKKARQSGRPFDAVLMDLTIPGGMGGKETIAKLLKIDPEVKAIVSSGYTEDPIMANFREYGFCAILAKPYKLEGLSKVLHTVVMTGDG